MKLERKTVGKVVCAITFQAMWLVLVQAAGTPASLAAAASAILMVGLLLRLFTKSPAKGILFVCLATALGACADTLLTAAGFIEPARWIVPWPLIPIWLLGLWALFACFLRIVLTYLKGRPYIQWWVGFFGGPFAYWGGARLGAVALHANPLLSYGALAVTWGGMCVALFALSDKIADTGTRDREEVEP